MTTTRRALIGGLPLGALALTASGEAGAQLAQAQDLDQIVAGGTLRVAIPALAAPPFFLEDDDPAHSVDIAMSRKLAESLDVQLVIDRSAKSFNDAVDLVVSGQVHLAVCKLSRTLARGRKIIYSRPYAKLTHALFINRLRFAQRLGMEDWQNYVREFDGDLAILAKSSYHGFATEDFPRAKLHEYETWQKVFDSVKAGEVDAAYGDSFTISELFRMDAALSISARSITINDKIDHLAIGIGPGSRRLEDYVNLFLDLEQGEQALTVEDLIARYGVQVGKV